MLALAKGEYLGTVRDRVRANGVLLGVTEYEGGQSFGPMHYHEHAHLSFVLSGTMSVRRQGLRGVRQAVEGCSFVAAGELHQNFLHSAGGRNINLELEPEFFRRYELRETQLSGASPLVMLRLYRELLLNDDSLADEIHSVLLSLTNDWKAAAWVNPPVWVGRVRELLRDHWDRPVSLEELSRVADVHPVTVSKYFVRYFGTGLGEYRRRLKVERALALIRSSPLSLTEIAYACGFCDQSHFIRAFRALTHCSPQEFRKVITF